jgi:CRP-like cAMP-binding protein
MPFLKEMSPRHVEALASHASETAFEAGAAIIQEGRPADYFYVITPGSVAVEVNEGGRGPLTIHTIEENDVLGWSWIVPPYKWHFDARAITATRAVAVDARRLRQHCDDDHHLGYAVLRLFFGIVAQRLESACLQLLDLYGANG